METVEGLTLNFRLSKISCDNEIWNEEIKNLILEYTTPSLTTQGELGNGKVNERKYDILRERLN